MTAAAGGGRATGGVRSWPSLLIGFGIPALALLGGVTLLSGSGQRVLGWPVLYLWVFCCFPLTTLCLAVSWRVFDRPHYQDRDRSSDPQTSDPQVRDPQDRDPQDRDQGRPAGRSEEAGA